MNEFEIIKKYFSDNIANDIKKSSILLGIGDDASIVKPDNNCLAITTDSLVLNTHFKKNMPAEAIGSKALLVSISDLAAMGATPLWCLISLTINNFDNEWLKKFSCGFKKTANKYGITLIGGNTCKGKLNISVCSIGKINNPFFMRRSGASPGDLMYVSGNIGSASIGLKILQNNSSVKKIPKKLQKYFISSFLTPNPRIDLGIILNNFATSAIDISDGLAADIAHILDESSVSAIIDIKKIPTAIGMNYLSKKSYENAILYGGEDYELCFTVSNPTKELIFKLNNLGCNCIGKIIRSNKTNILNIINLNGQSTNIDKKKCFSHFK